MVHVRFFFGKKRQQIVQKLALSLRGKYFRRSALKIRDLPSARFYQSFPYVQCVDGITQKRQSDGI
jgi:hypothetical protein